MPPKKLFKFLPWLGFFLLIPSLIANVYLWTKPAADPGHGVARVINGDTFVTEDKSVIRFDTLDAPELQYCGGPEAKAELENLISNQRIRLDTQVRDVNGRQVASVWIGNTWIDEELIKTGWVAYSSSTVDKDHVLKNLDLQNRQTTKGIYSPLCTQRENIADSKCVVKGNIVEEWTKKGQKSYHFPGCIQYNTTLIELYRGEQWFCTEKQAQKAGYTKSGGCGPKSWK